MRVVYDMNFPAIAWYDVTNYRAAGVKAMNRLYKQTYRQCEEARARCNVEMMKKRGVKSADRLLYHHAVSEVRIETMLARFIVERMWEGNCGGAGQMLRSVQQPNSITTRTRSEKCISFQATRHEPTSSGA